MPRTAKAADLGVRDKRLKLPIRPEPYWRKLSPGVYVGYRRSERFGTWIARRLTNGKKYQETRLGLADDLTEADGKVTLSWGQAQRLAFAFADQELATPIRHHGGGITVGEAVAAYLREHRMAERTRADAARMWALHAGDLADVPVRKLRADMLAKWHSGLAEKARRNRGKTIAVNMRDPNQVRSRRASANRILTIVKAALNYNWRLDRLGDVTPEWQKVRPFQRVERYMAGLAPRMLDEDEIGRLLANSPPDLRDLLSAALMTGARLGELVSLRVGDYQPEHARVRIYQSKTGKTLLQPLTAEGAALFARLANTRPSDAPMLTRADGKAWTRHDAARMTRLALAAAGITGASFKTTRATYGKLLLLATHDIELVARALGHSDSRVTRAHYAAYLPDEVAAAVAKLPSLGIVTAESAA
jgi:integrase